MKVCLHAGVSTHVRAGLDATVSRNQWLGLKISYRDLKSPCLRAIARKSAAAENMALPGQKLGTWTGAIQSFAGIRVGALR